MHTAVCRCWTRYHVVARTGKPRMGAYWYAAAAASARRKLEALVRGVPSLLLESDSVSKHLIF